MRIALIGPGIIEIPPKGWGAVESLIWDYYRELKELGHFVKIINTQNYDQIIRELSNEKYDFIHVHYDIFYNLLDRIDDNFPYVKIGITSHYPYIDQPDRHRSDKYRRIYKWFIKQKKYFNFCISQKDYNAFKNDGANNEKLYISKNGAQHRDYFFTDTPIKPDKTLYLGKIELRKRQYIYQDIKSVDFVGRYTNLTSFDKNKSNYLGEWDHQYKLDHMTDYGNMLLLSDGENGTPLVIKEALISGLGIVISKYASDDLNLSLPFISVIPDEKLDDLDYIESELLANREVSKKMRNEIRRYGIENFSWEKLVKIYIDNVEKILLCN